MKRLYFLVLVVAIAAVGCSEAEKPVATNTANINTNAAKPKATPAIPHPGAPRISLADAKADFDAGTAVFVDTHSPRSFENEHIAGAVNVPADDYEAYLDKLPKGKKIIAYCS